MKTQEIIKALRRIAVNTGTLNCLGCGYEHSCGVHGCRMLREAADRLEQLQNNQRWYREVKIGNYRKDGDAYACLCPTPIPAS